MCHYPASGGGGNLCIGVPVSFTTFLIAPRVWSGDPVCTESSMTFERDGTGTSDTPAERLNLGSSQARDGTHLHATLSIKFPYGELCIFIMGR